MYLPRNSFALFLYVMLNIKTFQNRLFVGEISQGSFQQIINSKVRINWMNLNKVLYKNPRNIT